MRMKIGRAMYLMICNQNQTICESAFYPTIRSYADLICNALVAADMERGFGPPLCHGED